MVVAWDFVDSCVVAQAAPTFASDSLYDATVSMLQGWGSCLVDKCDRVGPIFFEGVDHPDDQQAFVLMHDPIFVFLGVHPASFDDAQADVDDIVIVHWVACRACVGCTDEEAHCKGFEQPFAGNFLRDLRSLFCCTL